jgi:hypothetical protein
VLPVEPPPAVEDELEPPVDELDDDEVVVVFGVVVVVLTVVVVTFGAGFCLQGCAFVLFWWALQYGIFFGVAVGAALAPRATPMAAIASSSRSGNSRRTNRFPKVETPSRRGREARVRDRAAGLRYRSANDVIHRSRFE